MLLCAVNFTPKCKSIKIGDTVNTIWNNEPIIIEVIEDREDRCKFERYISSKDEGASTVILLESNCIGCVFANKEVLYRWNTAGI